VSDHPVAGLPRYVDEVVRRLRDVPRSERESIGTDLVQHLRESGCETYGQCVERFGAPSAYADEMRTGLGLPPYRRPRAPVVTVALVALLAIGGIAVWRSTRPEPVPDDFDPLTITGYSVSGTEVRSAGGALIELQPTAGTARIVVFIVNASDRTLSVERVGLATVRTLGDGSMTISGPNVDPLRPGEFEISGLWSADVRMEPVPDPTNVSVLEHDATGEPFEPFDWLPGEAHAFSVSGVVAACEPGLSAYDGRGGPVTIEFLVDDHFFSQAISTYSFDTRNC
jgi:hypothetical protein